MAEMDNVSKKIIDDAEREKGKILADARERAEEIIGEAKKKKKGTLDEAKKKAEQKHKQAYDLEILKAKSEADQRLLLSKLKLVDETIAKAKQKIYQSDKQDYVKFIKKGLEELDIKEGTYVIGKEENKLNAKTVSSMGKKIKLKKSDQEPDFPRGIKVISENKEYLLSPQTIIDSQVEDVKMEVADLLFGKEK